MTKEAFPFDPFQDSLLGEVLLRSWIHLSQDPILLKNYITQNNTLHHTFTPNVKKQILMNTIPKEIRNTISHKNFDALLNLIKGLATGKTEYSEEKCLDVVLELLEWIWTGFPEESLVMKSLSNLYDNAPDFLMNPQLEHQMKILYDSFLAEPHS
jgi:hypothetical protein